MSLFRRGVATGTPAAATRRRGRAALLAGMVLLAAGCSGSGSGNGETRGELWEIRDERHRIENPSQTRALATGFSCAAVRKEALKTARRVARFNLRSLTGGARYTVVYELLREETRPGRICLEVSARAVPSGG